MQQMHTLYVVHLQMSQYMAFAGEMFYEGHSNLILFHMSATIGAQ